MPLMYLWAYLAEPVLNCTLQDPQLGKTVGNVFPLAAYTEPSSTMQTSHLGGGVPVSACQLTCSVAKGYGVFLQP